MKKHKVLLSIIIMAVILAVSVVLIKPIVNQIHYGLDLKGGFEVLYLVEDLNGNESVSASDITNTYKAIQNRIDILGVSEPEITIEGDKIRVKLPGVTDEKAARERLSTPAVLTFRNTNNEELMTSSVLGKKIGVSDDQKNPGYYVVTLDISDNDTFYRVTKEISESDVNIMAIWLDYEEGDTYSLDSCGNGNITKCISAASVTEGLSGDVIISGKFSKEQATFLAELIQSGSLPTKITEISTKTVDASFGVDTLKLIAIAGLITLAIISIILISFYRFSGVISSICLVAYVTLVFTIFNLIDGVLTLTGIAALILGIGMAVDSSIITLEKIKEEIASGKTLGKAYIEGNKRSLVSLLDANITTFLAAIVLFIFGESSVKGFATMLILTIISTMICCVVLNRYLLSNLVKSNKFESKVTSLLGRVKKTKERNYIKVSKFNIGLVVLIIVFGSIMAISKGFVLGIDFRGGSSLSIKSTDTIEISTIDGILSSYTVLEKENLSSNEAYYKIDEVLSEDEINNLREAFDNVNYKSNISVISNTVKKDLTVNAIYALVIASVVILVYIAIRFAGSYGLSSIIAILSDCLVTISIFAIFGIEINFIFVAGILTIIGYSINDTIVVFDLIRDKYKLKKKKDKNALIEVVNESVRLSLKRNILTSITTLSAIIVLLFMGINSIREFNITVLIGLTAGTFSSLFIAPYFWVIFENYRIKHPKKEDKDLDDGPSEKLIKGINV